MAKEAFVSVGYEGRQYQIPAEIAQLNTSQPGIAKAWIEEQIADKADRQARAKARKEESVEAEFTSVKTRLSDLESKEAVITNLQRENSSLKAAVEAQSIQIDALEDSGGVLGGANASARQTSFELSNAATAGSAVLAQLQSAQLRMTTVLDRMEAKLGQLQADFTEQATKAIAAGQTRQRLEQEASNRLLLDVARAEERAVKAEGLAAQTLSDAQSAKILSKDQLTRDELVSIVQDEVRESSPQLVNEAITVIREDEFHGGSVTGQRHDPALTRQRRADADAMGNIR